MAWIRKGKVFGGDYRVVRQLAKGGYGVVYLVEQISTRRRRALKVMLPPLVDGAKARARFLKESRIGAKIRSPHIVEVLAAGIDDETEAPWLVMELLEGETLAQRLDRGGAMSPDETLAVLREVGHALGQAHAQGIFHLDLKPENVFLSRVSSADGDREVVKILDFGIARLAAEARDSATMTSAIGSVLWMAPEQTEPGFKVSAASDVWALGLIVFRMLTGRFYWKAANLAPGEKIVSIAVLHELTTKPLTAASQRASELGCAPGALPEGFDEWFAGCTNDDLTQCFDDAGAAVDAFRWMLEGLEVPERSLPATAPLERIPLAPPIRILPPDPVVPPTEPVVIVISKEGVPSAIPTGGLAPNSSTCEGVGERLDPPGIKVRFGYLRRRRDKPRSNTRVSSRERARGPDEPVEPTPPPKVESKPPHQDASVPDWIVWVLLVLGYWFLSREYPSLDVFRWHIRRTPQAPSHLSP